MNSVTASVSSHYDCKVIRNAPFHGVVTSKKGALPRIADIIAGVMMRSLAAEAHGEIAKGNRRKRCIDIEQPRRIRLPRQRSNEQRKVLQDLRRAIDILQLVGGWRQIVSDALNQLADHALQAFVAIGERLQLGAERAKRGRHSGVGRRRLVRFGFLFPDYRHARYSPSFVRSPPARTLTV